MDLIALTLLLAGASKMADPPPELWYHQAVACAGSALVEQPGEPTPEQFGRMMTWGLIMADSGRKAGRTKEQVEKLDLETARAFYAEVKKVRPAVFKAHRIYCDTILSDVR